MIDMTPEYLASLRTGAEHAHKHNLPLQDHGGEITMALLDALQEGAERVKSLEADLELAPHDREGRRMKQRWHRFLRGHDEYRWVDLSRVLAWDPDVDLGTMLRLDGGVNLWVKATAQEVEDALSMDATNERA